MPDGNNQKLRNRVLLKHITRATFLLLLLVYFTPSFAQHSKYSRVKARTSVNLVANGNFEDINICTEFQALCEPEGWFFIPVYSMMPQGNDSSWFEVLCVGNVTYGFLGNSFIYTKLLCPLISGHRYHFSMWIATPRNEFEQLGVWFGSRDPMNSKTIGDLGTIAFTLTPDHADSVKRKWKKYNYTFTAKGDEKFIMLGNFATTPLKANVAINKNGDIFYSIDNVKLTPLAADERLCSQYYSVISQVYDQDRRHPPIPLDKPPTDSLASETRRPRSGNDSARNTARKKQIFIPPAILFDVDSSSIAPAYFDTLNAMANVLKQRSFTKMVLTGHTDNTGRVSDNEKLSVKRAVAVKQYLKALGSFDNVVIETAGAADTQPVAPNETYEGRQKNRRVEIRIVTSE